MITTEGNKKRPEEVIKEAIVKNGLNMVQLFAITRAAGMTQEETCRLLDGTGTLSASQFIFLCQCFGLKNEDFETCREPIGSKV